MLQKMIQEKDSDILKLQFILFCIKSNILSKKDTSKLLTHFVHHLQTFFKPVDYHQLDSTSMDLIKAVFRIQFVNNNYKAFEAKIDVNKERNQHWMVFLLSSVQHSFYEIAKTFYPHLDDYDNMFARFDKFLELVEDLDEEKESKKELDLFKPKVARKREQFSLGKIFGHKKSEVIKALIQCTNNLLTHNYFRNHPRRFVVEYIKSLRILLSLKSKRIFDFAGDWVEKNLPALSLCQSIPSIFRVIVMHRATYQLRKMDYEACILNLMDFLSAKNDLSREDYDQATEVSLNFEILCFLKIEFFGDFWCYYELF